MKHLREYIEESIFSQTGMGDEGVSKIEYVSTLVRQMMKTMREIEPKIEFPSYNIDNTSADNNRGAILFYVTISGGDSKRFSYSFSTECHKFNTDISEFIVKSGLGIETKPLISTYFLFNEDKTGNSYAYVSNNIGSHHAHADAWYGICVRMDSNLRSRKHQLDALERLMKKLHIKRDTKIRGDQ